MLVANLTCETTSPTLRHRAWANVGPIVEVCTEKHRFFRLCPMLNLLIHAFSPLSKLFHCIFFLPEDQIFKSYENVKFLSLFGGLAGVRDCARLNLG